MTGIACVGILCVDVLGKPVDNLPEKGKLTFVDDITLQIGGCAANVSIALAKIGLQVSVIGKIGKDLMGDIILETMRNENVGVQGLRVDPLACTSASMVMISNDSERSIIHTMGANRHFIFDDIDLNIIRNSRILLIAGTFLMPGFDGAGAEKLLRLAAKNNVLCCMDTAWDSTGQWMKKIETCLPFLDWFMPSYEEACKVSKRKDVRDMADFFLSKGVKNVVIKMDRHGCYVRPQQEEGFIMPSFNKINVKDMSGAGDSFCAGFLTGLYNNWDVRKCAMFANAAGAHCVMEIGTTTGIKTMDEILEFMKKYERGNIAV